MIGDLAGARPLYEHALAICEKALGAPSNPLATSLPAALPPTEASSGAFSNDRFTSTPAVPCAQKATIRDGLPKGPNRPIADLAGDEQIGYRT